MSTLKCKMCGGAIDIEEGASVCTCEYCGTKQTLPRLDDERKANLYDRANHFRRNNDYDKAMSIYEQILNEDNTDAESYWSIILCKYGIEYVLDPATRKYVPTVNRAQFASVISDEDYKKAIKYATIEQKIIYEEEAKTIDDIQKGILEISKKENPFDVFICYKETNSDGRRTQDSVLATDLYHQLTQEGFKVFFSRITLEDKLGTAYEPYIFAALHSAKVMVVLGTKQEYFNAVWVKNEWSRYLALIKNGEKKMLIPAYRDMDPYDLPEEFSHLQAQDMSKLGFMQDLIRGIKKTIETDSNMGWGNVSTSNNNVNALLKRVQVFLEDGEWERADEYCERVLDHEPQNAQAYLGKLMAELHVHRKEDLRREKQSFVLNKNYEKAIRFGDESLIADLQEYISNIVYNQAIVKMRLAQTERDYLTVAWEFSTISGFKDAESLVEYCYEKAKLCRKDAEEIKKTEEQSRVITKNDFERVVNAVVLKEENALFKDKRKAIYSYADAIRTYLSNPHIARSVNKTIFPQMSNDSLAFGRYGGNIIEWDVIERKNNSILMISKHSISYKRDYIDPRVVTWETWSLRKWLNDEFLMDAFDLDEQKLIDTTTVKPDEKETGYLLGESFKHNETNDKVFILSVREVDKAFITNEKRRCKSINGQVSTWWLRPPGTIPDCVPCVNENGEVDAEGYPTNCSDIFVRPAMWINLDS